MDNYPTKISQGSKIKVNENKYNKTRGLHKVFTDQSYDTAKSMTDTEKLVFRDILQKTSYYDHKPTKGRLTGRDRYIRNELDNEVKSILNLDTTFKGRGVEKIIILSNIIDIYTRLEILLGLNLSSHTHTLTKASNLIDELYKRSEIQSEQQCRNALNKISSH